MTDVVIIPRREFVRERSLLLTVWLLHAVGAVLIGIAFLSAQPIPALRLLFEIPGFPYVIALPMAIGGAAAGAGLVFRRLHLLAGVGFLATALALAVFSGGLFLAWNDLSSKQGPFTYSTFSLMYAAIALFLLHRPPNRSPIARPD